MCRYKLTMCYEKPLHERKNCFFLFYRWVMNTKILSTHEEYTESVHTHREIVIYIYLSELLIMLHSSNADKTVYKACEAFQCWKSNSLLLFSSRIFHVGLPYWHAWNMLECTVIWGDRKSLLLNFAVESKASHYQHPNKPLSICTQYTDLDLSQVMSIYALCFFWNLTISYIWEKKD